MSRGGLNLFAGLTRGSLAITVAFAILFACVPSAEAQLRPRRLGVDWSQGPPQLSFSARDLVNRDVREALGSGLRKRIVLTVQAFASGRRTPLATRRFACAVTYDLWEGAYVVRMGRRTELFAELQPVIDRCLVVRGLTVGSAEDYEAARGRPVYFAVRAEFNPISARRCRELLRSSRAEDPVGPLVINIVRREICQAERAIDFQSPPTGIPSDRGPAP